MFCIQIYSPPSSSLALYPRRTTTKPRLGPKPSPSQPQIRPAAQARDIPSLGLPKPGLHITSRIISR
ncbi:hypothetical protein BDZ94DRAFT_1274713 [Collybia nuda]|uniref:Uncharacterized protein n=1 Tax=Collybia nuda TaxID=64659 RepID=A0A9P6CD90_9AGAR|nr:hypothetical protein BDZ94DRAFT_1274713 [Collybia nuda]